MRLRVELSQILGSTGCLLLEAPSIVNYENYPSTLILVFFPRFSALIHFLIEHDDISLGKNPTPSDNFKHHDSVQTDVLFFIFALFLRHVVLLLVMWRKMQCARFPMEPSLRPHCLQYFHCFQLITSRLRVLACCESSIQQKRQLTLRSRLLKTKAEIVLT